MNLKTGFHQVRVKTNVIEKTASNTKHGQFEYMVMPMGMCNAPATFQSLINPILYDCVDVVKVEDMAEAKDIDRSEKIYWSRTLFR